MNITKTIRIFEKKRFNWKFLDSSSSLQFFSFETSTVKIAKGGNSNFSTILAQFVAFLSYFWSSQVYFLAKFISKKSSELLEPIGMIWIKN